MLKPQGGSFLRVFLSLFIFISSDVAISVNIFDEGRIKNINLIPTDTLVTELGAMKPQRLRPIAGQILSNISEQKFGDLILARLEYQTASFLTRALFYWDPDKLARVIRYLRENPYKT